MTPGAAEEAGKVAGGFIDAMKSQPLALALCVINFAMIGMFWYTIEKATDRAHEREKLLFNEQKEVRELLSKCVVPPAQGQTPPNLTPTKAAWFWQKSEPQLQSGESNTLLKAENEQHMLNLEQQALDDALKDHIAHLFATWMKSPGDATAADRASVGARNATRAYRQAFRAIEKKRTTIMQGTP
jgi:hypothetical protein